MREFPESVYFLKSAASTAAKARGLEPATPTADPLDVATALKCMNVFQARVDVDSLEPVSYTHLTLPTSDLV